MDGVPAINDLTFRPVEGGTLILILITYPSAETRDMVLGTGMVDGMRPATPDSEEVVLALTSGFGAGPPVSGPPHSLQNPRLNGRGRDRVATGSYAAARYGR